VYRVEICRAFQQNISNNDAIFKSPKEVKAFAHGLSNNTNLGEIDFTQIALHVWTQVFLLAGIDNNASLHVASGYFSYTNQIRLDAILRRNSKRNKFIAKARALAGARLPIVLQALEEANRHEQARTWPQCGIFDSS
jgi:hypothetical protein